MTRPTNRELDVILDMRHGSLQNYIVPGLKSSLIGGAERGCVRLFESSRDQQENITPHSHRFDFSCLVLRGKVTNRIWTLSGSGDTFAATTMVYEGKPGEFKKGGTNHGRYGYIDEVHEAGSWYSMHRDQIHSIFFSRDAAVLFFEGPKVGDHSIVLEPVVDFEVVPTFRTEPWMFQKTTPEPDLPF